MGRGVNKNLIGCKRVEEAGNGSGMEYQAIVPQSPESLENSRNIPLNLISRGTDAVKVIDKSVEELPTHASKEMGIRLNTMDQPGFYRHYQEYVAGRSKVPHHGPPAIRINGSGGARW